jgi:hypothetical protein
MTKKHFIAMAEHIRTSHLSPHDQEVMENFAIAIARQFNPRFDVERFKAACEASDA